jgi:hypothetical protein
MGGFDLFLLKTASLFRELMLRRYETWDRSGLLFSRSYDGVVAPIKNVPVYSLA